MKLKMTTQFLHLIEPGTYGTNLGDAMENLDEDYFDDFRNAIFEYGIEKINEILSEDSIVALFGKCKAENGSFNSPCWYNYENDSIEFDLIVPDEIIKHVRNAKYNDEFFKWTKQNYGSYSGFISFFPYKREQFEIALKTSDLDFSRAFAMVMMKAFEQNFCEEEIIEYQHDFEDNVMEEGNKNGWFICEEDNMED
jgi:hypothetical protein